MDNTERLELPFILPSQSQKHVTHNEALEMLDLLVHLAVLDDALAAPPASPAEGEAYIVAAGALGAWAGQSAKVARYTGAFWQFFQPREGWQAWVASRDEMSVYDGAAWGAVSLGETVARLGVNAAADAGNRLSVKSDGVLFSHDDVTPGSGDARVLINRSQAANSANMQFATAWAVNAEAGMIGDGNFAIKVSPDGAAFRTALAINPANGNIGINAAPSIHRLHVREDQVGFTQLSVSNQQNDPGASSGFTLSAYGGQYFNFQLYQSGALYAYSNARMIVGTYADKPLTLRTNTTDRITVHGDGRVSVGSPTASAMLAVSGAVRLGDYVKAALPSASANGAGALIHVNDATGGSAIAFSDGTNWRRIADRSVID